MIVLLLFGLALAVGSAQQRVISTLQAGTAHVKRYGGLILLLVGLWTLALAIWASAFAEIFPV